MTLLNLFIGCFFFGVPSLCIALLAALSSRTLQHDLLYNGLSFFLSAAVLLYAPFVGGVVGFYPAVADKIFSCYRKHLYPYLPNTIQLLTVPYGAIVILWTAVVYYPFISELTKYASTGWADELLRIALIGTKVFVDVYGDIAGIFFVASIQTLRTAQVPRIARYLEGFFHSVLVCHIAQYLLLFQLLSWRSALIATALLSYWRMNTQDLKRITVVRVTASLVITLALSQLAWMLPSWLNALLLLHFGMFCLVILFQTEEKSLLLLERKYCFVLQKDWKLLPAEEFHKFKTLHQSIFVRWAIFLVVWLVLLVVVI